MLTEHLGVERVALMPQDNYYRDNSANFDTFGGAVNFDHPNAIDWRLLEQDLKTMREGNRTVQMPIYDYVTHARSKKAIPVEPKPYVIVEGILIFVEKFIRDQFDFKIYIQTREELRFARRLKRDVSERGFTEEGMRADYFKYVKPMHDQFVEPSAQYADRIISGETDFALVLADGVEELCR